MTPAQWVTAFLTADGETQEIQAEQVFEYRQTILRQRAEIERLESETCALADARDAARAARDGAERERAEAIERLLDDLQRGRFQYLRAGLDEAETRVLQAFTDADAEGRDLSAMTAAELTTFVMAAIKKEGSE
jgi:hypothetical protein